jgi:hypothetical protein
VAVTGAKADLLQRRQALLVAEKRISDLTADLNDLLGLPGDDVLEVTEAGLPELTEPARDQAYDQARARNGEFLAASETLEKSRHAVRAAKYEYIPDVTLFARHGYQDGAPFLEDHVGIVGAELTWNIFDWGKRKGESSPPGRSIFRSCPTAPGTWPSRTGNRSPFRPALWEMSPEPPSRIRTSSWSRATPPSCTSRPPSGSRRRSF